MGVEGDEVELIYLTLTLSNAIDAINGNWQVCSVLFFCWRLGKREREKHIVH